MVPEIWCATDGQTDGQRDGQTEKVIYEVGAPPKHHVLPFISLSLCKFYIFSVLTESK